jgi:hypothetical protein
MSRPSVFVELKRRNVLRAAAFYAASVWLLVQVVTQVIPFFHIAEWVVRKTGQRLVKITGIQEQLNQVVRSVTARQEASVFSEATT